MSSSLKSTVFLNKGLSVSLLTGLIISTASLYAPMANAASMLLRATARRVAPSSPSVSPKNTGALDSGFIMAKKAMNAMLKVWT